MRVAVTGGCGFIGSHVVDHLVSAGHEVLVLDKHRQWANPAAEYLIADVFADGALDRTLAGRDAVFHLAGMADVNQVTQDPVHAIRLNVEGVGRVLDTARRLGCGRVVLASTVWVYGATAGRGERTEDALVDLARAGHLYVSTKLAAEMVMHSYQEMYGQEFSILRYGIPYGPRMREALVVARFVRAAQQGEPITIAGSGDQQRNFVYVEDLAEAHVLALGRPRPTRRWRWRATPRSRSTRSPRRSSTWSGRCRSAMFRAGRPTTKASASPTGSPRNCSTGPPLPRSPRASAAIWPGCAAPAYGRDLAPPPAAGRAAAVRIDRHGTRHPGRGVHRHA